MKRAVYSVEIKVERDKTTGQTRVLSSHTKLPVDCSHGGVKVYEDEQKVVHEVNGQHGVHLLSAAEVDELILKANQAADQAAPQAVLAAPAEEAAESPSGREITMASGDDAVAEFGGTRASPRERNAPWEPVAGTFPGHQRAQDRDRADEVLGLRGSVETERVLIQDGKTSPPGGGAELETAATPPTSAPMPRMDKHESPGGAAVTAAKGKKASKCCSTM